MKQTFQEKNYIKEINKLLNLPESSTVKTILNYITETGGFSDYTRNKIIQYLRKIKIQSPKDAWRIKKFLKIAKKTKLKTFKITIANAFALDTFQGDIKLYFNGKLFLDQFFPTILIDQLLNGINEHIIVDDPDTYPEASFKGTCPFFGSCQCCPGFHFDLKHDKNYIIIYNIWGYNRDYTPSKFEQIEGTFRVHINDYKSEILRLKEIEEKSFKKLNIIPWKHPSKKYLSIENQNRLKIILERLESIKESIQGKNKEDLCKWSLKELMREYYKTYNKISKN